jgi:hypothetical protein
MWTLVVFWLIGSTATSQSIAGFESQQACGNAFNELHDDVTWGLGIKFVGKCVQLKEASPKK